MQRILIFIVAYNAERHIASVLSRIPETVWHNPDYQADCIIIDDCSTDNTVAVARAAAASMGKPIRVFRTPHNQGYGGNQKLGFRYAIDNGYDAVVLLHGDGQYAPECLPEMIAPLREGRAQVVFGSRMMEKQNALKGGMPYYKYIGNQVLTAIQNRLLGLTLTEFHSGYRAYATAALQRAPFICNSNRFSFDTDIIIQLADNGIGIHEIPIPTHYGDEVCHVPGFKYAWAILRSTLQSRLMRRGIFYARKFDYEAPSAAHYRDKTGFDSSHSFAVAQVPEGAHVLDVGDSPAHVARALKAKGCTITGLDHFPPLDASAFDAFIQCDISTLTTPDALPQHSVGGAAFTHVLLLDVIEHMPKPEAVMDVLWRYCEARGARLILTTPNIAFFSVRFMLLLGWFQYGRAGILDRTHTRLFTFRSARHLATQSGFRIAYKRGIPAPFPLALQHPVWARRMLGFNRFLIRLWKTMFSYQIAMVLEPRPDLSRVFAETVRD